MAGDSELTGVASTDWILAAIVEVEHADRIQCQCKGCGQTVYKRVHVIVYASGAIECWGSACYARELGVHRGKVEPLYSGFGGRRLTDEEREWLKGNRERLIGEFREAKERLIREAAERAAKERRDADERNAALVEAKAERLRQERAAAEQQSRNAERRAAEAAREIAATKQSRPTFGEPRHRQSPPQSRTPPGPAPEPADDPMYREIYDRLAARWAANGIDINRPGQRIMFLKNVRAAYTRERGHG